jgi:hypothetical protein
LIAGDAHLPLQIYHNSEQGIGSQSLLFGDLETESDGPPFRLAQMLTALRGAFRQRFEGRLNMKAFRLAWARQNGGFLAAFRFRAL